MNIEEEEVNKLKLLFVPILLSICGQLWAASEPVVVSNLAELEAAVLTGRDIQVKAGLYPVKLILELQDGVTIQGEPGVQFDCESLCLWAARDNTIRDIEMLGGTVGVSGAHSMDLHNLRISNMNNGVFFRMNEPGEVAAINVSDVVVSNSQIGMVFGSGTDATTLHIKIEDSVFEDNPNGVLVEGGVFQANGNSTHVQVKGSRFSRFSATGLHLRSSLGAADGGRMTALVKSNTFEYGQNGIIGFSNTAVGASGDNNELRINAIDNSFSGVFFDGIFAGGFTVAPPLLGTGNITTVNFARNAFTGLLFGTGNLTFGMAISGSNLVEYTGSSVALNASSVSPPANIEIIDPETFVSGQ